MIQRKGFTLIELLISIAIASIISYTLYFSLTTALDSWEYSRDQLALQKVVSEAIDEVTNGTAVTFGLKDTLEIISAGINQIEFVPPWTDDTHNVASRDFIYTLNRRIKPGSAIPIAEVKLSEEKEYRFIPVTLIQTEDNSISQMRLGFAAPVGSQLRFTYHPDQKANPDVIKRIFWDAEGGQIYSEGKDGRKNISRNPFGVRITNMRLRYYNNASNLITPSDWVDNKDLNLITGIEVFIEAQVGQYTSSLVSFVDLRNSPLRSGYLSLTEGSRIHLPDSHNITSLLLTNFSGVSNGDILQLEATPRVGKIWRVKITFSRAGLSKPMIENYTIEYPHGHPVYTEYPRSNIDLGLNLLTLDANGLYDYDDDEDIEDFVILDEDVVLEVKKMDIEGAGLFVRP